MASVIIPQDVDQHEAYDTITPNVPAGWQRLTVTKHEETVINDKQAVEVFFTRDGLDECSRVFYMTDKGWGWLTGFLKVLRPDLQKFGGLAWKDVMHGRQVDGFVIHKTKPWTNKDGKVVQITNAEPEKFRPATGAAPAPSGNGSAASGAAGTPSAPPAPPPSQDLPF